jgi:hypothetical protein
MDPFLLLPSGEVAVEVLLLVLGFTPVFWVLVWSMFGFDKFGDEPGVLPLEG